MAALQVTGVGQLALTGDAARAVPVVVKELRALLQSRSRECPAAPLFVVERALLSGSSLNSIAADVIKDALAQLDLLGCRTPGLGILRLQMARQIATNDARQQADQLSTGFKWRPEISSKRVKGKADSTLQFDSGFPDTMSTTPGPHNGADS